MSRYDSICKVIMTVEAIERIYGALEAENNGASAVRRDLQDIAKDIRYGGEWHGDYEKIASQLENCSEGDCTGCKYMKAPQCRTALKKDAAAAIRKLARG